MSQSINKKTTAFLLGTKNKHRENYTKPQLIEFLESPKPIQSGSQAYPESQGGQLLMGS